MNEVPTKEVAVIHNPRIIFDKAALQQLTESIDNHGLLQPIVIRHITDEDLEVWVAAGHMNIGDAKKAREGFLYELIAGERRLRAHQMLGLNDILVRVMDCTAEGAAELRLIENVQRENLHPIEESYAYEELRQQHGWTVPELAARAGRSERYIRYRLLLLKLTAPTRAAFIDGKLLLGHALLLATLDGPTQKKALAGAIRDHGGKLLREPISVPGLRQQIQRLTRVLKRAPFDIKDAKLVPKAGACGDCPFRSSLTPELFVDDVQDDDSCTSPSCFENKVHVAIDRAVAKGVTAVALHPGYGEKTLPPLVKKYKARPDTDWRQVHHEKCDDTVAGIIVSPGYQLGSRIKVCLNKSCKTHRSSIGYQRTPEEVARDRHDKERSRRLTWMRAAAMGPVVEALATGPDVHATLYRLVVGALHQTGQKMLRESLGLERDVDLVKAVEVLDDAAQVQAMITGLLGDELDYGRDSFDGLAAGAGVDLSLLFAQARDQKKKPILIPEDVLGTPYPTLARMGKRTSDHWDDRPWHVIKPQTTATTLCKKRVKGPDKVTRVGFPGRHQSSLCKTCTRAVLKMIEAQTPTKPTPKKKEKTA